MSEDRVERLGEDVEKLRELVVGNGSIGLAEQLNRLHYDIHGSETNRDNSLMVQVGRNRDNIQSLQKSLDDLAGLVSSSRETVISVMRQIRAGIIGIIISLVVVSGAWAIGGDGRDILWDFIVRLLSLL